MKQNNIIISTIKTKIGNFYLELYNNSIVKFLPSSKNIVTNNPLVKGITNNLNDYFLGKKKEFKFRINPQGTDFQKKVWNKILTIKYAQTRSYYEIAGSLSSSPRAVGNACAKNPCLLFIPCHRVINKNNFSGNYIMGKKTKMTLLNLENEND